MSKYIAIKLCGMRHWLWFETANVVEDADSFEGKNGWGLGGAHTSIKVDKDEIVGRIWSEALQYN